MYQIYNGASWNSAQKLSLDVEPKIGTPLTATAFVDLEGSQVSVASQAQPAPPMLI
jgi:hypothetical protein